MTLASRMIAMLTAMESGPRLDTPEFRAMLARPVANFPPTPPREDFAEEPSGRIAALRARADMNIRSAVDDLKEAERMEKEAENG